MTKTPDEIAPETTVVYLTPHEAELFVQFQKRFAFIKLMESLNVFDIRSGSVTVNFDKTGKIASVEKKEHFSL